jgi:hypothetical protein
LEGRKRKRNLGYLGRDYCGDLADFSRRRQGSGVGWTGQHLKTEEGDREKGREEKVEIEEIVAAGDAASITTDTQRRDRHYFCHLRRLPLVARQRPILMWGPSPDQLHRR